MGTFSNVIGGVASGLAQSADDGDEASLMSKAQRSQDLEKRRQAAAVVAQSLEQERQRFAALQQAAPAAGQGLRAVNAHAQQVNAASVRIQQLESVYKQTFGFMPAELEKLGVARA